METNFVKALGQYLAFSNYLLLGGIGKLELKYVPAKRLGSQLNPPSWQWYFTPDKSLSHWSPEFLTWIAKTSGADEAEFKKEFTAFWAGITAELNLHRSVYIEGFGTLLLEGAECRMLAEQPTALSSSTQLWESQLIPNARQILATTETVVEEQTNASPNVERKSAILVYLKHWKKIAAVLLAVSLINILVLQYLELRDSPIFKQEANIGEVEIIELAPEASVPQIPSPQNTVDKRPEPEYISKFDYSPDSLTGLVPVDYRTGRFEVIIGAYQSKENAEQKVSELKKLGYEAVLAGQTSGGLYRVSAGSFTNGGIAEAFLDEIKNKVEEDAWLMEP